MVLAACDPRQTLTRLLPAGTLPQPLQARADGIPTQSLRSGHLKVDMAFRGRLSQAPEGQDTAYLWSGLAPANPPEGWETLAKTAGQQMVSRAAGFYEGIEGLEIGRSVESPLELAARTRVPDGNPYHVDMAMLRSGPLRPALGFGGYRTPVPGLYLTGAGTHPGPAVSGIPGRLAAQTMLQDLKRKGLGSLLAKIRD